MFAKFLILSDTLLFEYFGFEGKIIPLDFANKFNNKTSSNYVNVSIKLCPNVGNK